MARSMGASEREMGLNATLTQLGYVLAMVVLVPPGERYGRRASIVRLTLATVLALGLVAVTNPSLTKRTLEPASAALRTCHRQFSACQNHNPRAGQTKLLFNNSPTPPAPGTMYWISFNPSSSSRCSPKPHCKTSSLDMPRSSRIA